MIAGAGLVPALLFTSLPTTARNIITDTARLEGALGQIAWAADALEGLRRDVNAQNAHVFPIVAEACVSHIRAMTVEARAYVESLRQEASPDHHLPTMEEIEKAA